MINAWSLLDSELNGTMDEDYPVIDLAHYFKYHEEEILKDIEEYVSATYREDITLVLDTSIVMFRLLI